MVSCIKQVNLKSEGTLSGYKGFMAVGINPNLNEDITSRGRVWSTVCILTNQAHYYIFAKILFSIKL